MSRLTPKESTIKKLFALSGNRCAYFSCTQKIVEEDDILVGEICHIEANRPDGARYNEDQSDEERRGFDNLLLLCPSHHKIIDKNPKYSVPLLKDMKRQHEDNYRVNEYQPNRMLIGQALYNFQSFDYPWWIYSISYGVLSYIYSAELIRVVSAKSPHFLINGAVKKSITVINVDNAGPLAAQYELESLIFNTEKQFPERKQVCLVYCNSLIDNRHSYTSYEYPALKKAASSFFQYLSHISEKSRSNIKFVFLIECFNLKNQFSIIPKSSFSQYCWPSITSVFKEISLDFSEHDYYESHFKKMGYENTPSELSDYFDEFSDASQFE